MSPISIVAIKGKYHRHALKFDYDYKLVERCRSLKEKVGFSRFGFDGDIKAWAFSLAVLPEVILAFPEAEIDDQVQKDFEAIKQVISEVPESTELKVDIPLFPYQKKGAEFAIQKMKALIADEPGLGKSVQALAVAAHLELKKVLIVCPASLKSNWQNEVFKWLKEPATIIEKDPDFSKKFSIINYERLQKHFDSIMSVKWDLLICDEAHYIKNFKAIRTQLVKKLALNTERVICLTGTPLMNRPVELAPVIESLGYMKVLFGSRWAFLNRYCGASYGGFGWDFRGSSNEEELARYLKNFMIRRLKKEVLPELPEKLVEYMYIDMADIAKYRALEADVMERLKEVTAKGIQGYAESLAILQELRMEVAEQKHHLLPEMLQEYLENKQKVIVFTVHRKVTESLNQQYHSNSVMMHGQTKDRQLVVDKFRTDPKCNFMFATMKTAGVGFNINECDNVIFLELAWTPTDHKQAEDRVHRIGKENKVHIKYLILKGSIDEYMLEKLLHKSELISKTVGGKALSEGVLEWYNTRA